jgi:hypothetical protein
MKAVGSPGVSVLRIVCTFRDPELLLVHRRFHRLCLPDKSGCTLAKFKQPMDTSLAFFDPAAYAVAAFFLGRACQHRVPPVQLVVLLIA